jgi:hypothetical protein
MNRRKGEAMIEFFQAGGWSMFLILALGLLTLGAAAMFMRKPEARDVGMIRGFSVATVFAVLCGVATDLATVFTHVPNHPEWAHSPDMPLIVMTGLGESLTPAILGFSMLTLAWLVTAVGVRRLGHAELAA